LSENDAIHSLSLWARGGDQSRHAAAFGFTVFCFAQIVSLFTLHVLCIVLGTLYIATRSPKKP
jgi:hypothetical protein